MLLPVARAAGSGLGSGETHTESDAGPTITRAVSYAARTARPAEGPRDDVVEVEGLAPEHRPAAERAGLAVGGREE